MRGLIRRFPSIKSIKNSYQDIRKLSNTGNQENLNADIIKTYQVPWAPDEEQERISTILTTQDKVIELKEKQLTGKQRQKKYLMQQLLTGKKRLPGFAFEVEKTNIKAISTYSVSTISQTMLESYEGKQLYPVFNANSIAGHVDFYENECPYISIIKDGAGIGRVRLCEAKSSTIGTMGCIHDPSKMIAAQIEIRNISATPLSLERYVFNGVERVISPYRLPPAVQFPDAYYYINLPSVNHMDYASFTLHFEDTTQRKWRVPGRAEFKSGTWELSWEKPQKI